MCAEQLPCCSQPIHFLTITAKLFIMKKLLFLLLTVLSFVACKKEAVVNSSSPAPKINLANAVVVSKGDLMFSAGTETTGLAKIYRQTDGNYVLGLENMNYKTTYDLHVYLSKTPYYTGASVKLFSSLNFTGSVYYMIVGGIQVEAYNYIVIQKDAAMGAVAVAQLQ